jgi:hypothetical protein
VGSEMCIRDRDGVWRRVEEKLPERWRNFRGFIGSISPTEDFTLEPGTVMPGAGWHWQSHRSRLYGQKANLVTITDTNHEFIQFTNSLRQDLLWPSNPPPRVVSGATAQPQRNWTSRATVACDLKWRDWHAWVFNQPRVKIRITQSLYNQSPSSRPTQPCYEFTIKSPPIEVDSDLIRQSVVESRAADGGAPAMSK